MSNVEDVRVEADERGFELHLLLSDDPVVTESGWMIVNVHAVAEELYDQVKGSIGPWLYERDLAKGEWLYMTADQAEGYDLSDPKHPDYHSIHADIWDMREGK